MTPKPKTKTKIKRNKNEPAFIAQTSGLTTPEERQAWIIQQLNRAYKDYATFWRATIHPERRDILLIEAWKARPKEQGEPRWNSLGSLPARANAGIRRRPLTK